MQLPIFNSLPNDKILHLSNLKACADDNPDLTQEIKCLPNGIENIVEKVEMLVTSIFFYFQSVFQSLLL